MYEDSATKRCGTCKTILPVSEFRFSNATRSGLTSRCVGCANSATNDYYLRLKLRAVTYLGDVCNRCGYGADHRALAIDHIDGNGNKARKSGASGSRLYLAILSDSAGAVQLLCYNCNTIKRVQEDERGDRAYSRVVPTGLNKRCPRCFYTKRASEFYRNTARPGGLSSYCRECMNAASRESYAHLRQRVLEHLGGCCSWCGYDDDPRALVLDHIDGGGGAERRSGVTTRTPLNAILAGADNYQLLCANCNQIKQFENGERVGKRIYKRLVPIMTGTNPSS